MLKISDSQPRSIEDLPSSVATQELTYKIQMSIDSLIYQTKAQKYERLRQVREEKENPSE
jgi:hypothetical protein